MTESNNSIHSTKAAIALQCKSNGQIIAALLKVLSKSHTPPHTNRTQNTQKIIKKYIRQCSTLYILLCAVTLESASKLLQ